MLALKMLQDLGFMEDPVERLAMLGLEPSPRSTDQAALELPTHVDPRPLPEDPETRLTGAAGLESH